MRYARILRPCNSVDLLEQGHLLGEGHQIQWAGIGVKMAIGSFRRGGMRRFGRVQQLQRLACAGDRCGADFVRMGKAGCLAGNASQAEPRISTVISGLQPAIVKGEALGRHKLEIKLAIVARRQQPCCQCLGFLGVELVVKKGVGIVRWRHTILCRDG